MKNIIYIGLILLISIIFLFSYKNFISKLSTCHKQYINITENQTQKDESLLSIIYSLFTNDGRSVRDIELFDEKGRITKMNNIIHKNNKLIFYFSDKNCITCIDSALAHLNCWSDRIGRKNIIIIVSYKDSHRLKVLRKIKEIPYPIYNMNNKSPDAFNIDETYPMFFVLTNDYIIHNLFICDKNLMIIIDNYFKATQKNYFNKLTYQVKSASKNGYRLNG